MSSLVTELLKEVQGVEDADIIHPEGDHPPGTKVVGVATPIMFKMYTVLRRYEEKMRACLLEMKDRSQSETYEAAWARLPGLKRRLSFLSYMLTLEARELCELDDRTIAMFCKDGVAVLDMPQIPISAIYAGPRDSSSEVCGVCERQDCPDASFVNLMLRRTGISIEDLRAQKGQHHGNGNGKRPSG